MLLFHTLFPVVLYHCRAFLLILDTALLLVPLAPAPAPLAHSTPLHNISMPPVSSCRSFFHPCFSSSYLFVLTLAQSLHPASSDPWMLFFPATFCSPCMVQRIEKAMANIWKKKKKKILGDQSETFQNIEYFTEVLHWQEYTFDPKHRCKH